MENIELAQERKRSEVPLITVGSNIQTPKGSSWIVIWCGGCHTNFNYKTDNIEALRNQKPDSDLTHCPNCGARIAHPKNNTAPLS
jgi:quinolinate synthase